jgi:hypothetical protein
MGKIYVRVIFDRDRSGRTGARHGVQDLEEIFQGARGSDRTPVSAP